MTDQEMMEGAREKIDKRLREEMLTIGTSADNAKTGQMWAYDSERLSKIILNLKWEDGSPMIGVISKDQSYPEKPEFYNDWGGQSGELGYCECRGDMWEENFRRIVKNDKVI